MAEKIVVPTFDILVDEEGAEKIADAVVEKMRSQCPVIEKEDTAEEAAPAAEEEVAEEAAPAEETASEETAEAEETVEETAEEESAPAEEAAPAEEVNETAEEIAETETAETEEAQAEPEAAEAEATEDAAAEPEETAAAEETVEETAEEESAPAEEAAEAEEEVAAGEATESEPAPEQLVAESEGEILSSSQSTIETEIAVTTAEAAAYEEGDDNNLVDAETGLVIRLKRSFTAKMKQSDPAVKQYYSDIKNELTSYKRLNSNLSWHGDRFNFGRETVAKLNICGKTLCFYVALDPNDPEYKTTVYHQKDVGAQRRTKARRSWSRSRATPA